jgi:hypothetical protein
MEEDKLIFSFFSLFFQIKMPLKLVLIMVLSWHVSHAYAQEDEILYKEGGIVLSHKGIAFHTTTDIYVALKTHLATEHILPSRDDCEGWTKIRALIKNLENEFFQNLEQIVPCHFQVINSSLSCNKETRQRRALFSTLLGIGVGGFSLYEMFQNHNLAASVNAIKEHEQELNAELFKIKQDVNRQIKITRSVVLQVKEMFIGLHSQLIRSFCHWSNESRKINSLINSYIARSQIKEMLTDIFMNKLTAEILNPLDAHKVISNHSLLQHSLYTFDLGLLYTLAKTFLYKINFQTRVMDIIIRIPLLKHNAIANIYEINNLGIIFGNQHAKLKLPKLAYVTKKEILEVEKKHVILELLFSYVKHRHLSRV